jgi:hypothetical protein
MKTIPVTRRAAVARFKRRLAKEGQQLRILKRPIDSLYRYAIVDADSMVAMTDFDGFVAWLRKDGVLKPYEVVDIACLSTRRAR